MPLRLAVQTDAAPRLEPKKKAGAKTRLNENKSNLSLLPKTPN